MTQTLSLRNNRKKCIINLMASITACLCITIELIAINLIDSVNFVDLMRQRSNATPADSTLIVGGLDWLSIQHLDTIRSVIYR